MTDWSLIETAARRFKHGLLHRDGLTWPEFNERAAAYFRSIVDDRRELREATSMDLIKHLERQRTFSVATFGPGHRTTGVIDHIRKELMEIEADPLDLEEWADVILLALDGAWRTGASPQEVALAIDAKMTKNEGRQWPDWREVGQDKAIEHVRT